MARRDEILKAAYEADRLHREFGAKAADGRVNVFKMLINRDIPVIFRPLDKLLGAFVSEPDKGIIVTSRRPLSVQRFTAAHELGHEVLGHETSYDEEEILTRALFGVDDAYDPREIQANAFASHLLTPQWLIAEHMRRQGWNRRSLVDPFVVYQLSLRMGSSYSATIYALEEGKAIDASARERLLAVKPKSIKQFLVKPYEPENWYGDVWLVTDLDGGMVLEGSRTDLVVFKLEEHASAGYLWQLGDLIDAGLMIRADGRAANSDEDAVGGVVFRTVIAESNGEGANGHVSLRELRPWQASGTPLQSVELEIDLSGPVSAGLLAKQREMLLGVA